MARLRRATHWLVPIGAIQWLLRMKRRMTVMGVRHMGLTQEPFATAKRRPMPSVLRLAGPVALAAIIGLTGTFLWQSGALKPKVTTEKQPLPAIANPEQPTATTTTYTGVDEQNRPFAINAAAVEQSKDDKNLVHMQHVDGTFQRPSGQGLTVTAPAARYRVDTKALQLEGGVTFAEPGRMVARMENADVDVNTLSLTSNSPVEVDMQGTLISAQSLVVTGNGTRIHFKGGVKARFVTKP